MASVTPENLGGAALTSTGRICAAGQAGAVSVMRTPTAPGPVDDDVVDQTELVDVDRNLRVVDLRERLDDLR